MRSNILRLTLASLLLLGATAAYAGGPLLIFNTATQTPWRWGATANIYTDRGPLSTVGSQLLNADARNLVVAALAEWSGVPTSSFSGIWAASFTTIGLPNIDQTNTGLVIGVDNAEANAIHVIYDTTGLIFSSVFGAPPGVLGVSSPEYGSGGLITESWTALNGSTVDSADTPLGLNFGGVVTHELGHAIGLAHTQTNGARIFFGDNPGPGSCARPYAGTPLGSQVETMYPFIDPTAASGIGQQFATIDLPDDETTLSDLNPAGGYPNGFATISGTIYNTNGSSPLGGVNVIARNVANPFADTVSALSGDFTQSPADGRYKFTGLTPGADYVVYVDEIVAGGFSTPPVVLPGPEEYWTLDESENPLVDAPCDYDTINVPVNTTATADIKLNAAAPPATIAVAPTSFVFNVPVNGTDSDNLTISNTAVSGAENLDWTIDELVPPGPAAAMAEPSRVEVRLGEGSVLREGAWAHREVVNPDASDPRLLRGWGEGKIARGATSGPPVAQPYVAVADGGFEAGTPNPSWTEASTNFGTPICDTGTCGTGGGSGPHGGLFWAWFGGIAAYEAGSVSQSVVFPNVAALDLEFYLEVPSCDSASDYMEARVDGNPVFTVNGGDPSCGMVGYQKITVDVSAYADGASHTLTFASEIFANNGGGSNFFLDDVDLVVPLAPCPWLAAVPGSGSVAAGSMQNVTVSVDATGLAVGSYDCELQITSNASNAALVTVPVTLNVTAAQNEVNAFVSTVANGPVSWFSTPAGGGVPLTAAYLWDMVPGDSAIQVDGTIEITLTDGVGDPIVGYPAANIGVQAASGGWVQCAGSEITADADTDVNGITTISGVLYASGHSAPGELLQITIDDPDLNSITYAGGGAGLDIRVNSVDIADFGATNLVDLGEFANDFNSVYDYRSDFLWDGALNLADVGSFAAGNGSVCPGPRAPEVAAGEVGDVLGIAFDASGRQTAAALEPGEIVEAYLLLRGPSATAGVTAWAARLETSSNVEIVDVTLPDGALNVGEGHDYVVGNATALRAAKDQPLRLATLRLRARDDQPAQLSVRPTELGAAVAAGGQQRGVQASSGSFDVPVATLNDGSAQTMVAFEGYRLRNTPNPFNPATEIHFDLPHAGRTEVRIFDVSGRLVTTLDGGRMPAGANALTWRGTDHRGAPVVSGIYYYKLFFDGQDVGNAVKMSLLK